MAILLNDEEYAELKERAKDAHLPLAAYCRSYLLTEQKELTYITGHRDIDIRGIRKPEPPPDPYLIEREKTHAIFKEDKIQEELFERLASETPLDKVPMDILLDIRKRKEERKHEVNKHLKYFTTKRKL